MITAPFCSEADIERIKAAMLDSGPEALELASSALLQHPTDSRLTLLRGSIHASDGRYQQAFSDLSQTLVLEPEQHVARFMLGYLELCQGNTTQAVAVWRPISRLDTALGDFSLGLTQLVTGHPADAQACLQRGLERNEENPQLSPFIAALLEASRTLTQKSEPPTGPDIGKDVDEVPVNHLLLGGYRTSNDS